MRRKLEYGKRYKCAKGLWPSPIAVEYEAMDSETPWVILKTEDGKEYHLADCVAVELIAQIQRALDYMPSSK